MISIVTSNDSISLKGTATLQHAKEIKVAFLKPTGSTLNLNLSGVTECDLSFLQLLLSLKTFKAIAFQNDIPDCLTRCIKQSGMSHHFNLP